MEEFKTEEHDNSLIVEINQKLRQLSNLNTFVMFLLVSFITILAYEPFRGTLEFLPDVSITTIILNRHNPKPLGVLYVQDAYCQCCQGDKRLR